MSESINTRVSCGTPIAYKGGGGSYLNDSIESYWYLYEAAQRPATYCRSVVQCRTAQRCDILSQLVQLNGGGVGERASSLNAYNL